MPPVSRLFIFVAATLVPFLGSAISALPQETLPLYEQSASGSFLAGQQAFKDLRTAEAASYFLNAAEVEWENPVIVDRAFSALVADGRIDDAAALGKHLLELKPDSEMVRLVLGSVALKERRYAAAASQFENVRTDSFVGLTGAIVHGWALVGDEQYAKSQDVLDTIARPGLDEFLIYHRALMADVAGERAAAIAFAAEARDADPFISRVVEAYVRMLGNAARFDEARKAVDAFEAEGLSDPMVSEAAAAVRADIRPGKLASTPQAGAAEMFRAIGNELTHSGSRDYAIVFLRLGEYLDPNAHVIDMAIGELLDDAGQHELANGVYERIPGKSAMKATAVVRMAGNLSAMGDRDEAIRQLGNIAATEPDNLDAVSVLGDELRYAERYEEAIDAYTMALALAGGNHPRDWRFYYVRGIANERARHWPAAEADFLKALDLNPDHPQVLNYLGYSWVDQGVNFDRALDMIRKAVDISPNDGYIVDSLGWAYYKLGRVPEAVETLERAVQLRPNDPEINDHLGDAYWKAGRKLEARFQWSIAIDVDKDGDVSKRAQPKLASGLDGGGAN